MQSSHSLILFCVKCVGGLLSIPLTVTLGKTPSKDALKGVPTFGKGKGKGVETEGTKVKDKDNTDTEAGDSHMAKVACQTSTLMSLLKAQGEWGEASKTNRVPVWLGDGLNSIPKRVYERMLKWEVMDMNDFRPRAARDRFVAESDTEKLIVLPGFEVSQPKRKPVDDIFTWIQCFARYTAAMAKEYPECTPGFMSHLLTVMKAYAEAKPPAWQDYDMAFREKMASTGKKDWTGMDVALYHELCSSRPKQGATEAPRVGTKRRQPESEGPRVCFDYNDGVCRREKCKFSHLCEVCLGYHRKRFCDHSGPGAKRPPRTGGNVNQVQRFSH